MPYIADFGRRTILSEGSDSAQDPGELAFVLYGVCADYLHRQGSPHYSNYASVVGVLETVKLELFRRQVAPYEDAKIAQNGDV